MLKILRILTSYFSGISSMFLGTYFIFLDAGGWAHPSLGVLLSAYCFLRLQSLLRQSFVFLLGRIYFDQNLIIFCMWRIQVVRLLNFFFKFVLLLLGASRLAGTLLGLLASVLNSGFRSRFGSDLSPGPVTLHLRITKRIAINFVILYRNFGLL